MAWHRNNWINLLKIISYVVTAIAGAIGGSVV